MTGEPESASDRAGATPSDILAFLETAPESVRGWADQQAQLIRRAQPEQVSDSVADELPADPNDIALAELDEIEDDIPVFRRRKKKSAPVAKPAEAGYSERRVILISLAIALVVGIGSGVFFANQSNQNIVAAQQMQMPDGHPDMGGDNSVPVATMAELEAQILADETDTDALVELGTLRFDNGEFDIAEELWLRALEIDPNRIEAHYNLGFAYLASDPPRPEQAIEAWNTVIDIDPESDLAENVTMHVAAIAAELANNDTGGEEEDGP
ncbi:tetratricopeptide repeat protein [Flaviflexus huanghaiensis]|uniref:tetratricopeptide repeat protein n=1 Tax=Flaviflexus huanghaiensis TaxID=1111473 RepID=UPI0015FBA878|nr:tetratricopeptide repeat protein [Flaviflexus huanghaiensis]